MNIEQLETCPKNKRSEVVPHQSCIIVAVGIDVIKTVVAAEVTNALDDASDTMVSFDTAVEMLQEGTRGL